MTKALHNLPRNDRLALMRILTRTATREADNLSCIFAQPGEDELIELAVRSGRVQTVGVVKAPKVERRISPFATGQDVLDVIGLGYKPRAATSVIGRSVPMDERNPDCQGD